jgi:serine/threonine-protein kinase
LLTLAVVALIIGGAWGGWRAFSSYLFVPEVTVPNFVGQPLDAAEEMARTARLALKVSERVYSSTAPIGAVISQDQPSSKIVKEGRTIYVAVSLGPEMVLVPDVQRRSLLEARLLIDQARLRIGELREAFDEEIKGGFVISQDPQPGARVERGRPLNLVISKGPQRLEMPPLVGRSLQEARQILQDLGVTLAAVNTTPTPDVEPGIVVAQSPRPGTRIRAQDPVTVTITIRPGEEAVPPPDPVVTAQPQPSARPDEKVTRVQLVVPEGNPDQEVKIVVIDERGVRTVFQKPLSPGSRVTEIVRSRGYTIIQVYVQGRLVQEIRP